MEPKREKQSSLLETSKLNAALQALGYSDITFHGQVEGVEGTKFTSDFYSPSTNTLILVQDSEKLCYDRVNPNGEFRLKERVAKSLPSQPKIFSVNIFQLVNIAEKEQKISFLTEKCSIPLVGEKVNLEVEGL